MNLPLWYQKYKEFIEHSLEIYIEKYLRVKMTPPLEEFKQIITYSTKWGKKLRGILALTFYLSLSGEKLEDIKYDDDIAKLCIALEVVHAFSLIHDDLPCMDNDELRRWELTVWKKYGEYQAILAGDMMNSLTFELISDMEDPKASQCIAKIIAHSIWIYGMVGGQVEDMYYEKFAWELDRDILIGLHSKKTWKLIEASITSACVLSWKITNIEAYWNFGKKLGLAFQVKDDILDVEGTQEETGKSIWGEEKWFVHLIWLDASKKILSQEIADCKKIIEGLGSSEIDYLIDFVAERKK